MKTFSPAPSNKKARNIVCILLAAAFVMLILSSTDLLPSYRSVMQLGALVIITVALVVWCRYLLLHYTYSIEEDRSGIYTLIVYQTQGRRSSAMLALPLTDVFSVETLSSEELKKKEGSISEEAANGKKKLRKYNFLSTISPNEVMLMLSVKRESVTEVVLEPNAEFAAELESCILAARQKSAELYGEEEE